MTTPSGRLSRFPSLIQILQFIAGAIAIGVIFWQLQFSTSSICCGDFDGYYHIKWTRALWESIKTNAFPPAFPWLPLTTLNAKDYVDHHLLFHIIQIPFAAMSDPRLGAKIASAVFGSLAMLSCYWLLMRYRVRFVLVWLVALLACSAPFLFRMNMAKAPPFVIIFLIIAIHLFFQRKYWPLLPLALIFTWTYDLFVLLIMATVFWVITIGITETRFEWRPLVFVLVGCAAGLVLNPYFPHNFELLVEHMKIKITPSDFDTKVGSEWYPYDSWEFLGNSAVACIAMLVGFIAFEPSERRRAHHPIFFLLFATALMIMTARWKRIAEYWPPFAVLFAGFSLKPWLDGFRPYLTRLPADVMEELKPFLDSEVQPPPASDKDSDLRGWAQTIAAALVALVLCVFLFFNLRSTMKEIGDSEPHDLYQAGAEWMRANVPPGQIIFNTDWDDFPRLYYFDPTHYYVSGLDPSYLYEKDPRLSRLYDRITLGQEADPGPLIRDRFGARYVFSDNNHHDFFEHARASGWFDIVYEDSQCTILYIRDEKLGPVLEDPFEVP
ncbi:MAG TPA: transglutaminaseTgpA domain-containing protein [Pyrinomonadaceae bacterium]|nr:transglutaminaseTgpA domain-containing protein [Pyrinomonadaceae bacterium]